jgi:hypothetical protein
MQLKGPTIVLRHIAESNLIQPVTKRLTFSVLVAPRSFEHLNAAGSTHFHGVLATLEARIQIG